MGWIFLSARESFDEYRELWDSINEMQGYQILLDSAFVSPLIRYFSPPKTLLAISKKGGDPAMALVHQVRTGFWQTFQPSQAPIGLILLSNYRDVVQQLEDLVVKLPGYCVAFSVLQQDPNCTSFATTDSDKKLEILPYIETPRLTLRGNFEDYWKSRSRNLKHNLSRQRRRLAEQQFQLELAVDRDPGCVDRCIREYGRLESAGWKGELGTAVSADNHQGLFYRDMLENFSTKNEGSIYQLLLNGKTVASNLCIQRDETIIILKTTYDQSIRNMSPGLLLLQDMLMALFQEEKIKVVEFYGRVRDWHRKWTDEIRTMYHVNFYRHSWVKPARDLLKSIQAISRKGDKQ